MYEYECPRCGANLDPGEKCDCSQNKQSEEGNKYIMEKNEILNSLKLSAELNKESMRYIESLIRIADEFGADRDEIIKREIKALFISTSGSFKDYKVTNKQKTEEDNEA